MGLTTDFTFLGGEELIQFLNECTRLIAGMCFKQSNDVLLVVPNAYENVSNRLELQWIIGLLWCRESGD